MYQLFFFSLGNRFQFCALELVLEKERESFWLATVQPMLQVRDELSFRASQLRQQKVPAEGSDQEQVLQKVFVSYQIKTSKSVCSWHQHRRTFQMSTHLNITWEYTGFLSQNVLFKPLNKESPALLSRFLNAPAQLMEEFRNLFACSRSSACLQTVVHSLRWISCLLDSRSPKVTDAAFGSDRL